MKNWLIKHWGEYKSLVLFLLLMIVFRSALADWNAVPTGSMQPTIVEGDRILVNKMAYDLRIPLTHISLFKLADPARGDIVVFDSKASKKRLVKRIIGLPGDTIKIRNNILFINEIEAKYQVKNNHDFYTSDKTERLLDMEYAVRVNERGSRWSNFGPVTVPENSYFAMGDSRDNSADSRVIGFVPRNEIVGRTRRVVMSLNYDNNYWPRKKRFLHQL